MKLINTLVFLLSIGCLQNANSIVFDFDMTFDGTSITLDSGSTIPAGTSLSVGDSFDLNLRAAGNDFWRVDAIYDNVFVPLDFFVLDSGARQANIESVFFLDGIEVASIIDTNITQSFVHIGAEHWTLAAGLEFDTVSMNYSLLSSTAASTVIQPASRGSQDFFDSFGSAGSPFFRSDEISYQTASVPESSSLALLVVGFLGIRLARYRRN